MESKVKAAFIKENRAPRSFVVFHLNLIPRVKCSNLMYIRLDKSRVKRTVLMA